MSLKTIAADLAALVEDVTEEQSATTSALQESTRLLARGAVDYVLSEAEECLTAEDIGTAIALAASAAAADHGLDPDELIAEAQEFLREIIAGTHL